MKKENLTKRTANAVANLTTKFLKGEANSASCIVMHQPKAPKELARFKKSK